MEAIADEKPTMVTEQKETGVSDAKRPSVTPPPSPSSSEEEPLRSRQIARWWLDEVNTKHGDLLLFACCLVQGLLDCTSFKNWAVFIGMQTGNTVILCLSTASLPSGQPWAFGTTLISIIAFFIGCFFATRISMLLKPARRLTLTSNFAIQFLLIVLAAGLTTPIETIMVTDADENPHVLLADPRIMIGIAPLAFQSGMTIATSRMIGFGNEVPVTVYTSTYAALAGDPKLFKAWPPSANKPRNRRIVAVICVFVGALIATWVEVKSIGMIAILWMAAGIKLLLVLAVAFLFSRKEIPASDINKT